MQMLKWIQLTHTHTHTFTSINSLDIKCTNVVEAAVPVLRGATAAIMLQAKEARNAKTRKHKETDKH